MGKDMKKPVNTYVKPLDPSNNPMAVPVIKKPSEPIVKATKKVEEIEEVSAEIKNEVKDGLDNLKDYEEGTPKEIKRQSEKPIPIH